MTTRIQVRRDSAADWNIINPTLAEGEIGYETDTGKFKIGNGSSLWSALDYFGESLYQPIDNEIYTRQYFQANKLVSLDLENSDFFGYSVAISGNNNTMIVGAAGDDQDVESFNGAAYIYEFSNSGWNQQTKLLASDIQGFAAFGCSVDISQDGNTVAVGAFGSNSASVDPEFTGNGAVYIFTRSGSTWTQQAKLLASDLDSSDNFGISVSLSPDGNMVVVGAPNEDTSPNSFNGAAYVFTRSGSTWTQESKFIASDPGDYFNFGRSVSLSSDKSTVVVGCPGASAAYVFTRSGTSWTEQEKLIASDAASFEIFGHEVSISGNGNIVLVGAYTEDTSPNTDNGAAYVFARSESTWTQQAKLLASDAESNDNFGISVNISSDGNTAIIGSRADQMGTNKIGKAYIFDYVNASWSQTDILTASDGVDTDKFGNAVVISEDKNTIIVGARFEDTGSETDQGAVYVFNSSKLSSVDSYILSQLDSKLSEEDVSSTYLTQASASTNYLTQASASTTYATQNSPTFTGTVTFPSGAITSSMISDGTIVNADISSSAAISVSKISGAVALTAATGPNNIGISGLSTNTTGANNVAIGAASGQSITSGVNNVTLGVSSGPNLSTGGANVIIGVNAAMNTTTGGSNVAIGVNAGLENTTGSGNVFLGAGASPVSASVSNVITLGSSSIATLRCQQTSITALSDERDKTDIINIPYGLDFVKDLRPVVFKWDTRPQYNQDGEVIENANNGKLEAGFIAQELLATENKLNTKEWSKIVYEENPDRLEAAPGKLLPILVKAIQELSEQIESLNAKIVELESI